MNFIALSVPVFFILIAIEWIASGALNKKYYRLNDAITNLSCGIGQQILGAFFGIMVFSGYTYIYDNLRITEFDSSFLNWIILFLGVDFCYYWFHRLSHEINAIWATHIVHHQSEEYNLSVALRQSWFQVCFSWLFYIPLAFAGFHPIMILTVAAFNTLYQFWIHTRLIHKMGPLEWIFNTPSHHRVHHGTNPEYIDKNHGGSLIIWDRLFGTFAEEKHDVVYGITKPLNSWNPLWANIHYWKELFQTARKTESIKEKLKVFVKPPGWYPAELGGFVPPPEVDPANVQKFDIAIKPARLIYTAVQFFFIIGFTTFYMFEASSMLKSGNNFYLFSCLVLAFFILLSIYSFGKILENSKLSYITECIRLILLSALPSLFLSFNYFDWLLPTCLVLSIASLLYYTLILPSKSE